MPTKTQRPQPNPKRVFKVRFPHGLARSIRQQARVWRCTPDEAASRIVAESLARWPAVKRPRRNREDLEREARAICPANRPKANFTAAIRDLK